MPLGARRGTPRGFHRYGVGLPISEGENRSTAQSGGFNIANIKLTRRRGGFQVKFDQAGGWTLSDYKLFRQAIAQLRYSVRGVGHLTIPYDLKACHKLARKVGFKDKGDGFNGRLFELADPYA